MNQNEIMIRSLIRECLIAEQLEEYANDPIIESSIKEFEKINKQIEKAIVESCNSRLNEDALTTLGIAISSPLIIKFTGLIISGAIKLFSNISSFFKKEKKEKEKGSAIYDKLDHVFEKISHAIHGGIHSALKKLVNMIIIYHASLNAPKGQKEIVKRNFKKWCENDGAGEVQKATDRFDFLVTLILGCFSAGHALHYMHDNDLKMAGFEIFLTAVKVTHGYHAAHHDISNIKKIIDKEIYALNTQLVKITNLGFKTLSIADKKMDNLSEEAENELQNTLDAIGDSFINGAKKSIKIAAAAGISASLILSPDPLVAATASGFARNNSTEMSASGAA